MSARLLSLDEALDVARSLGLPIYKHEFGSGSRVNLEGVLPTLVRVAELAICLCEYDGTVIAGGGVRTLAQAQQNVANNKGILNSRHRLQEDGLGHAIDLIPLIPGRGIVWTGSEAIAAFRAMCTAVSLASAILSVPIRQGCDWDMDGVFYERNEDDLAHFEDPKEVFQRGAVELLHARREQLGLTEAPITEREPVCRCPHCGQHLKVVEV